MHSVHPCYLGKSSCRPLHVLFDHELAAFEHLAKPLSLMAAVNKFFSANVFIFLTKSSAFSNSMPTWNSFRVASATTSAEYSDGGGAGIRAALFTSTEPSSKDGCGNYYLMLQLWRRLHLWLWRLRYSADLPSLHHPTSHHQAAMLVAWYRGGD